MDSLKLLITDDPAEAQNLAAQLNHINQERQQITQQTLDEARSQITQIEKILVLQKETWHEGVIGLVAGKIKEEFYRPAVVIAKGEKISRGSARSVEGFNIVKMLRQTEEFLIDAGGHQMAAGFTIETAQIPQFQEKLLAVAGEQLSDEALTPVINIDTEVSLSQLDWNLLNNLKKFEPFGVGNPKPTFLTQSVRILNIRTVGNNGNHLKLTIRDIGDITGQPLPHLPCIGFGFGEWAEKLSPGDLVDIVYNLEEDTWNGERYLQLKLKDLRKSES
jgi:single-stranded-DNA-specific exonuclease